MAEPSPPPIAARRVMSPCKSICVMDTKSDMCIGCKRTIHEIARWPMMNDDELAEFERLLDVPDPQAVAWIIGGEHPPREFDTPLFARLCGLR